VYQIEENKMEIKYITNIKGDKVINKKISSVNQGKVTSDFQPVINVHTPALLTKAV
jgi:hypothetical protein